jgi:hypothetical protein
MPVRNTVLDQTIRFIQYKQGSGGIIPFWIDQLCIEQDDTSEHEKGMQSMDLGPGKVPVGRHAMRAPTDFQSLDRDDRRR